MAFKYIESSSREQITLFSLDTMVKKDSPVRIINEAIDNMNLKESDFANQKTTNLGRPGHNPILLAKLYIYSYFNGIRSSRKIEQECTRNIELMWLMGNIVPDHKCISDFRRNNKDALNKIFSEFLLICDMCDLLDKTLVAVDGTKIRANNSKNKCYTPNKLQEMLNYFEKRVNEYERILEENDEKESRSEKIEITATDISEIKNKLQETKDKIDEVTKRKEKMETEKTTQVTMTDSDSRLMKASNKGFDVSYNAQIAVENKNHIIVAIDVTNQSSDVEQLSNMATKIVENLKIEKSEKVVIPADKGYYSANEIMKCEEDERINVIVAVPNTSAPKKEEKYNIDNFKYNDTKDTFTCPEGQILIRVSKDTSKEQVYKNAEACNNCENKNKCTKAGCREITTNEKSKIREEAKIKLYNNLDKYAERQKLAEHPFGTIKRALGFTNFLMRGLEKVKIEHTLHVLAYNFKRFVNIIKQGGNLPIFKS